MAANFSGILILKFPHSSAFGGQERHTLDLFQKLKDRGASFYLLGSCPFLHEEFKKRNWPAKKNWGGREPVTLIRALIFPITAILVFFWLWPQLLYYRVKKKTKILYCLTLTEKLVLTLPARIFGFKVYWLEHKIVGRWLRLNPWRLLYIFNSNFSQIIAVSEAAKESVRKLGVRKKIITVIYNGLDEAAVRTEMLEQRAIYNILAEQNNRSRYIFRVGTICRLTKEKGLEYLLQALSRAKEIIPHIELTIIGDGPEKNNLIWMAKKIGIADRVRFIGFQPKVSRFLADWEIFILSSALPEAFGLVILNAMALRKPVIATKIGGIPEVVEDGETGILVPPKNLEQLAEAIINLEREPERRKKLGDAGHERFKKYFTLDRMAEEYIREFEK